MSVTMTLRKCLSEEIRVDKTFDSTADIQLSGYFLEKEDVLNPIIMVNTTDNLSGYNYVELAVFGRKYFMKPEVINNKLWRLVCRVDVLSSYAAGIKASSALVSRTAKDDKINYYINDGALYTEQREVIEYFKFKKDGLPATLGTDSYYLIVAGG